MADAVVALAAQWIGSLLIEEVNAFYNVEDQVRGLQQELEFMQQYLQDADAKQQVRQVRTLITQIRSLAYDAEDVIDTYILKVQSKTEQSSRIWLGRFACFLYTAPHIYQVGKQIEAIQNRTKRIMDKLNGYGVRRISTDQLEEGLQSSCQEKFWKKRPRSYPYDDNDGDFVVGLEKDIRKLVEVLMGEGKNQVNVLSIVGMGGSGKTTLAKKLYNHPFTKECFDCTAWIFISQEWSAQHVLSEMLRKVGGPKERGKLHARSSVEELVDKVRNVLKKKSYLVVLDDVWRTEAMEEILPALPRENIDGGSKIIITTRNLEIVQFLNLQRNLHIHEPRPLSEEEGWELFSRIALSHRTNYNKKIFESLGKEMLKKCDGLPLAIVALAGILNTKSSIRGWQHVSEAVRARVMESSGIHMYGRVGDLLALSYDDLPYDLKPCFLHLAIFPEDCRIPTGMLTRMWIAEGLIPTHRERSPEDIATQRLEELSNRFMVQVVRTNFKGDIKAVRLHDMLRDLCVRKAKEQSFLEIYTPINDPATNDASTLAIQPRRAALHSSTSFPIQASHLRSIVLLSRSSISYSAYIHKDLLDLGDLGAVHQNFKLLRLLSLWGIKTVSGTLPAQIGSLIHLRYLGVRATNITELPTTIGNLRNLLTLDYRNIESDNATPITIPNVFGELVLLRHLFLPVDSPWSVQELTLRNLRSLQTLWGVKQERRCQWLAREVQMLSTLKKLKIVVSTKEDLKVTLSCPSLMSDGLHTLHCELRDGIALNDVEPLSYHQLLDKLVLIGEIRMKLSLILPANLVKLELKDSLLKDVDSMVTLGRLAHLKLLRMSNSYAGTIFPCQVGSFPELEELYLENLHNLDEWRIEHGALLCLKKLEIIGCRSLWMFPQGLTSVTTLQQLQFHGMPEEFSKKATEYGWSQKRLRLPHNYETIIGQCDSPVDILSVHNLYEQLTSGVFLNNKKKRYWVVKQEDRYYNCFMVYAMDLTFDDFDCWDWSEMAERDGTLIKVASLKPNDNVLKVSGRINIVDLSPQVKYRISYVIMLEESASEWERCVGCRLAFPGRRRKEHMVNFNDKPRNQWIQILAGKFKMLPQNTGEVRFSLQWPLEWPPALKGGLVIKGVIIEPNVS